MVTMLQAATSRQKVATHLTCPYEGLAKPFIDSFNDSFGNKTPLMRAVLPSPWFSCEIGYFSNGMIAIVRILL